MDRSRSSPAVRREVEAEQSRRGPTDDRRDIGVVDTIEQRAEHLHRVWIGGFGVWIVATPEQAVDAGHSAIRDAHWIALERGVELAAHVPARQLGEFRSRPTGMRAVVLVGGVHGPRRPAGVHLDEHHVQQGVVLEYPGCGEKGGRARPDGLRCKEFGGGRTRAAHPDHVVTSALVIATGRPVSVIASHRGPTGDGSSQVSRPWVPAPQRTRSPRSVASRRALPRPSTWESSPRP